MRGTANLRTYPAAESCEFMHPRSIYLSPATAVLLHMYILLPYLLNKAKTQAIVSYTSYSASTEDSRRSTVKATKAEEKGKIVIWGKQVYVTHANT